MKRIKKFWPLAVIASILGIAAGTLLIESAIAKPSALVLPNANILYLVPAAVAPSEDIPGSSIAMQAEGVAVLHDFERLKRATEFTKPDAIIFHQLSLAGVDHSWIADQYRRGVVIAAINVKMTELAELVNDPTILNSPWPDNWYRKPYYAYAAQKTDPSGGVRGAGNDNLGDQERNLQKLLFTLKLAIKNLQTAH